MARIDELRAALDALSDETGLTLESEMNLACTFFDDVTDFLHMYEVPVNEIPRLPEQELIDFGFKHLFEELNEVQAAIESKDLVAMADGLADLVYVALNFAARCGLPFNEIWDAVQYANTHGKRKVRDASESKRGYIHDVIKDTNFVPPENDILRALREAGW